MYVYPPSIHHPSIYYPTSIYQSIHPFHLPFIHQLIIHSSFIIHHPYTTYPIHHLPTHSPTIHPSVCPFIHLSIHSQSIHHPPIPPSTLQLSIHLSTHPSVIHPPSIHHSSVHHPPSTLRGIRYGFAIRDSKSTGEVGPGNRVCPESQVLQGLGRSGQLCGLYSWERLQRIVPSG